MSTVQPAQKDPGMPNINFSVGSTCYELRSRQPDAHLRLGMVYESEKRYPLAVAELREAIRFKPDLAAPHYRLASVYREMGRKADSETEFAKVRRIKAASDNGVDVTKDRRINNLDLGRCLQDGPTRLPIMTK